MKLLVMEVESPVIYANIDQQLTLRGIIKRSPYK